MPLINPEQKYTYQDYLTWDDDERWEIIDGEPYNMSPAPSTHHQRISHNLSRLLGNALHGKQCVDFYAPTDVVFDDDSVVQPDVFVVCDQSKISKRCIQGAPDVIFEIISPSSEHKDRWTKKNTYAHFGVKEYILIDIDAQYAERFLLQDDGQYNKGDTFQLEEDLQIHTLEKLTFPMKDILEIPFAEDTDALN